MLVPYVREGVRAGDNCICVVDSTDPEFLLAALAAELADGTPLGQAQLDVLRSVETYLYEGRFEADAMLEFWVRSVGAAQEKGFPHAWVSGEMTWATRKMPGVEAVLAEPGGGPCRAGVGGQCHYDSGRHSELVTSLSRYLECGGSHDATAAAPHIHRSSLGYRLQRIREISGRDRADPDTVCNLQLATRAWRTLQGLRA